MKNFFSGNARAAGNALFIILIAIALLGALTTAVIQSGRSPNFRQKETVTLEASRVLKYGTDLQVGTDMLLSQGVDPNDIDFSAPGTAGYDTPPHTKKMFHPSGAGVVYQQNTVSGMSDYVYSKLGEFWTDQGDPIFGESHPDISFGAQVTRDVCQEINKNLYGFTSVPFTGTTVLTEFLAGNSAVFECDNTSAVPCTQRTAMCVTDLTDGISSHEQPNEDVFYAGWTINGEMLRRPGSQLAPQTRKAFATAPAGSEIYVYFHVLVVQ